MQNRNYRNLEEEQGNSEPPSYGDIPMGQPISPYEGTVDQGYPQPQQPYHHHPPPHPHMMPPPLFHGHPAPPHLQGHPPPPMMQPMQVQAPLAKYLLLNAATRTTTTQRT
jgi:hypothetical protein